MELPAPLGLSLVVVLVLANAFFVATEFAIVAVRRSRLAELVAAGDTRARAAQEVVEHLDAYIAACQLGITMASLALGWLGEPALAHLIEAPVAWLLGARSPAAAHGLAIGLAFALITALHIVIGELAPKGLALQRPDGTTLWVARPMQVFYLLFRWPITALNAVGNGALRLVGLQPATGREMVHSVEELRLLVTGSQQAGVVEASEARIASRAFEFADLTARALMTPRTEIEAVPVDVTSDTLFAMVAGGTHSRLPVYEKSLDQIVGVLYVHDLFRILAEPPERFDLPALLRPVLTIPQSKPADDLLEDMRASRRQLAVVVDEYGGTAGIVTLTDLMEGLVGPLGEEMQPGAVPPALQPEPDGSLVLEGLLRLREFEELTGLQLDPADHQVVDTLSGLVMARLGRLPAVGDHVNVAGRTLRVERLEGRRVGTARLLPETAPSPPEPASAASSPSAS